MARSQTAQARIDMAQLVKPTTPLGRALWGRQLNLSTAVDYAAMEWKFKLGPDQVAGPGMYLVVPAAVVVEAMQAEEQAVVLQPPEGRLRLEAAHNGLWECVSVYDENDMEVFGVQRRRLAEAGRKVEIRWYGCETRIDAAGTEWSSDTRHYVTDDFGFLAEVPR